jgi:hypothetical protein
MPQRMAISIGKQFRGLCCRCPPKSHRLMIFDMHCCIVAFIRPKRFGWRAFEALFVASVGWCGVVALFGF